jgi:hypothetical protein
MPFLGYSKTDNAGEKHASPQDNLQFDDPYLDREKTPLQSDLFPDYNWLHFVESLKASYRVSLCFNMANSLLLLNQSFQTCYNLHK